MKSLEDRLCEYPRATLTKLLDEMFSDIRAEYTEKFAELKAMLADKLLVKDEGPRLFTGDMKGELYGFFGLEVQGEDRWVLCRGVGEESDKFFYITDYKGHIKCGTLMDSIPFETRKRIGNKIYRFDTYKELLLWVAEKAE